MSQENTIVYHSRKSLFTLLPEAKELVTEIPFDFQRLDDETSTDNSSYSLWVREGPGILAMIEVLPGSGENRVLMNAFEVMPRYRGQGVGRRMLYDFLKETVGFDGKIVELDCRPELIPFYRRVVESRFNDLLVFTVSAGANADREHRIAISRK